MSNFENPRDDTPWKAAVASLVTVGGRVGGGGEKKRTC